LSGLRLPRENAKTAYHHKTRVEQGRLPEALGIAERSSTDRSSLFGAAFDAGEGTWARSEAQGTRGSGSVTNSSAEAGRHGSRTQGNARTDTEIPVCTEDCGCRERNGGGTDAGQEEATAFSGCLATAKGSKHTPIDKRIGHCSYLAAVIP
jgi:hypothetical protein